MLKRDKDDMWILGVCGGLGKTLNINSNLIRAAFVGSVLFFGVGIVPYFIILLIMLINENS